MFAAISDLALALIVAAASAIGAAIGGGIAGLVTYHVEEGRRRFDRQREQERADIAYRRAARLLVDELVQATAAIDPTIERLAKGAKPAPFIKLTVPGWDQQRDVLATYLSDEDWVRVSHAISHLHVLAGTIAVVLPDRIGGEGWDEFCEYLRKEGTRVAGELKLAMVALITKGERD